MIINEMKALLDLFEDQVPDRETNRFVWKFCNEPTKWTQAHELFSLVRNRNLKAIEKGDKKRETQYCFEEAVIQTLYNLTRSKAPFDPDSPYWVIKNALILAKVMEMPIEQVINIVT